MNASIYSAEVDLANPNDAHSLGVLAVVPGSRVLDVGAADGSIAKRLTERRCQVWGIEFDPVAAEEARRHCERVVVADVEELDLAAAFPEAMFDYILCLDVLEHLRQPGETLRRLSSLLAPRGRIVTSIPNVAHASVRLQLLRGRFAYTKTGLLDETHLRFFDPSSVERLFEDAGLTVIDRLRTTAQLGATEIPLELESFTSEVSAEATAGPDAETYQFVWISAPAAEIGSPAVVSLGETLQSWALGTQANARSLESYARSLETEMRAREEGVAELESAYRRAAADLAAKDGYIGELEGRLEELQRHPWAFIGRTFSAKARGASVANRVIRRIRPARKW